MYARLVDDTAAQLRELRRDELGRGGLTVIALGLAVAAHGRPAVALPLLAAGLGGVVLSLRALWQRWELVDRLLLDRDAYVIADVRARAERIASLENRQSLAGSILWRLDDPCIPEPGTGRLAGVAEELAELARELEDDTLQLDPVCAVDCERLLTDGVTSPLLNSALPADELRGRIRRIRSGFAPRGNY